MLSLKQTSSVLIQPDNSLLSDLISTSVCLVHVCFLLEFKAETGDMFCYLFVDFWLVLGFVFLCVFLLGF